jgi:hypothetical protein
MGFIMQSTACNAVHSVEQRLARWLLHAQDRMETDEFPLTQEFVAMMLGATRPTVTVVAGTLQKAGLITYHRGHVTIVDRGKLEAASCECHRAATELLKGVTSDCGTRVRGPAQEWPTSSTGHREVSRSSARHIGLEVFEVLTAHVNLDLARLGFLARRQSYG